MSLSGTWGFRGRGGPAIRCTPRGRLAQYGSTEAEAKVSGGKAVTDYQRALVTGIASATHEMIAGTSGPCTRSEQIRL